jgi:oligopeptide/dipeptide ABC transporter ATP-binding protein
MGMAIIVITHNMGVIAEVADRVLVMYAGRIVEQSPAAELFDAPQHPYTKGLLACVPTLEQDRHRLIAIPGSLPEPARRPPGCRFAPRCAHRIDACGAAIPPLVMQRDERAVACIRADEPVAS